MSRLNIYLFSRSIMAVVVGLAMIGAYLVSAFGPNSDILLYMGLGLTCVGGAAIAFRCWLIRIGHEPWFFGPKKRGD